MVKIRVSDRVTLRAEKGKEEKMRAAWAYADNPRNQPSGLFRPLAKMKVKRLSKLVEPHKGSVIDKLKSLQVATARQLTRYAIHGIWIEKDRAVATDGRRLFALDGDFSEVHQATHRLSRSKTPTGRIATLNSAGGLTNVDEEGFFPDYLRVIPEERGALTVARLKELHSDVRLAMVVTSEESNHIEVFLNPDDTYGFTSGNDLVGRAEINILEGARLLGRINAQFLLDAVRFHALNGDKIVQVFWGSWRAPLLMRGGFTTSILMSVFPDQVVA